MGSPYAFFWRIFKYFALSKYYLFSYVPENTVCSWPIESRTTVNGFYFQLLDSIQFTCGEKKPLLISSEQISKIAELMMTDARKDTNRTQLEAD